MSSLFDSGETWAALQRHPNPLAVFQMSCLQCICGMSLLDHVPTLDMRNTVSVESWLQSKRLVARSWFQGAQ